MEAELLDTLETISSWLPADDRQVLDEIVARCRGSGILLVNIVTPAEPSSERVFWCLPAAGDNP